MSRNFAVVLIEGGETLFLPTLAMHLHQGETGWYFLAHQIEPNGVYLHLMLARDGDEFGKPSIELHIPHHVVRYVLAAQTLSQIGF
jgi:hypothetical protein